MLMRGLMPRREGSVFLEDASVLHRREYPQGQHVLRLHAPRCAAAAKPGQFIHLQCDPALKMRRPYSIMSASPEQGRIDILYKAVGRGSLLLSEKREGDVLSSVGPIGNGFEIHDEYTKPLLLGGGVGIPPVLFLAALLKDRLKDRRAFSPFVVLASERPFPFDLCESGIAVAGVDDATRTTPASHSALEAWGIAARLCSAQPRPGCFKGFAHELAGVWLSRLSVEEKAQVEIFACGPAPMLAAVAGFAREHALPCQLSLEEYMACALGGCAGCVVPTFEQGADAMRRVCVDGPVFDAASLRF